MYDFKSGDKVQMDPAVTWFMQRGVGVVVSTNNGGTQTQVDWPERYKRPTSERTSDRRIRANSAPRQWVQTRDLVPVAGCGQ